MRRTLVLSAVVTIGVLGIPSTSVAASTTGPGQHRVGAWDSSLAANSLPARTPGLHATASGHALTAEVATTRPRKEHVPSTLHKAHLALRKEPGGPISKRRTVTGKRGAALVTDFDALKIQPRGYAHCEIVGGPQDTVTFRTAKHTWVATESACTNVVVSRDGKRLPTLLPSKKWSKAIQHYLGG